MDNNISSSLYNDYNNIFASIQNLSLYSPLIVITSMFVFGVFANQMIKVGIFYLWIFVITFLRVIVLKVVKGNSSMQTANPITSIPAVCSAGQTNIFIPNDVTYSTYILCFTLSYLLMPMVMVSVQSKVNAVNYRILTLFIGYILFDLYTKKSLKCINSQSLFTSTVIGDIVSGVGLGAIISLIVMWMLWKKYLFVEEVGGSGSGSVCSVSKSGKKFKCNLYKNGELVTSSNV